MNNCTEKIYNNLTRNGDLEEIIYEKNKQKKNFFNYTNTNDFNKNIKMNDAIKLATSAPNIFYSGPKGGDLETVEDESKLLFGSLLTKQKCKLNLQKRKYVTIPYLADKKTPNIYLLERKLIYGEKWKTPRFKFRSFLKNKKQTTKDGIIDQGRVFQMDEPYRGGTHEPVLELNLLRGKKEC